MMMSLAIPSEREKVSFSLRGDRDIDDRELSVCQLREGMLSEGQSPQKGTERCGVT